MGLQLVVGGAYSGKRKLIREQYQEITWHSAYDNHLLRNWRNPYHSSTIFVLEGWEIWIKEELSSQPSLDEVRDYFFKLIDEICECEKLNGKPIIFIMLEMGRGIVPITAEERNIRDVAGWVLQYAASKAITVQYCWHGLVKTIK
jgi:adenosylcobinamide kinase / adenosylcobinamide-phosphate guanylyltransferase